MIRAEWQMLIDKRIAESHMHCLRLLTFCFSQGHDRESLDPRRRRADCARQPDSYWRCCAIAIDLHHIVDRQ
ncbi:hypothetical protein PSAB6_360041 [Paraburkholderia sabiae]|nr:hypothetical protein PSAB6_360041 [Paraburkholderia sabiae]